MIKDSKEWEQFEAETIQLVELWRKLEGFEDNPMDGDDTEYMAKVILEIADQHQGNT